VQPVVCTETQFLRAIERYYQMGGTLNKILADMGDDTGVEVVSRNRMTRNLIASKRKLKLRQLSSLSTEFLRMQSTKSASDIHLEPYENQFRVRFRIDGVLIEVMSPPSHLKAAITSRHQDYGEI
jgi:type IV pilus assembly protein PilB